MKNSIKIIILISQNNYKIIISNIENYNIKFFSEIDWGEIGILLVNIQNIKYWTSNSRFKYKIKNK